jgi:hypothetical protein
MACSGRSRLQPTGVQEMLGPFRVSGPPDDSALEAASTTGCGGGTTGAVAETRGVGGRRGPIPRAGAWT